MIQLKCTNCGGIMDVITESKEAVCAYCGNKVLLKLAKGEKELFRIIPEKVEENEGDRAPIFTTHLLSKERERIEIRYLYERYLPDCKMFVTRENVLFVFAKEQRSAAERYEKGVNAISFPNDEMKKKMHYYFPNSMERYELYDEGCLIAIDKLRDVYPLEKAGQLGTRHMAWMISRLENISCLLEYSQISFDNLSTEDFFFDPEHHQILLYGGWQKAILQRNPVSIGKAIREIAVRIVSEDENHIPNKVEPALREFLSSVVCQSATEDFAYWDHCLGRAFGKREFIELNISEKQAYSN